MSTIKNIFKSIIVWTVVALVVISAAVTLMLIVIPLEAISILFTDPKGGSNE